MARHGYPKQIWSGVKKREWLVAQQSSVDGRSHATHCCKHAFLLVCLSRTGPSQNLKNTMTTLMAAPSFRTLWMRFSLGSLGKYRVAQVGQLFSSLRKSIHACMQLFKTMKIKILSSLSLIHTDRNKACSASAAMRRAQAHVQDRSAPVCKASAIGRKMWLCDHKGKFGIPKLNHLTARTAEGAAIP